MEIWKAVVGWETSYEVSSFGRVRSLNYRGHKGVVKVLMGTKLGGYVRYDLRDKGRRRMVFGHVLVLEAFVGPAPIDHEGCHNNGVRSDNALSNLRWDTQAGNQADRLKHGTDNRGEKSGKAKISEIDARAILTRRRAGESAAIIAKDFGVTDRTVYQIFHGERWAHIPS